MPNILIRRPYRKVRDDVIRQALARQSRAAKDPNGLDDVERMAIDRIPHNTPDAEFEGIKQKQRQSKTTMNRQ